MRIRLLAVVAACAIAPAATRAQKIARLENLEITRVADGFGITEGPYWHKDGYLLFVDVPGSKIYKWTPGEGAKVIRDPSGRANSIAVAGDGSLILAQRDRRIARVAKDGTETVLAELYQGKRLNSPNDLAMKSDGSVYFTDPPFGIKKEQAELGFNGVFRLAPDGTLQLLAQDFTVPNGIAFSPDEKHLYVNDSRAAHIRVFDVASDGSLSNSRVFAAVKDTTSTGDPDGMEVDKQGNVYTAGPGGIWVFSPDGVLQKRITIPEEHTTNLTWGDKDGQTLYVTAVSRVDGQYAGRLYRVRAGATSSKGK